MPRVALALILGMTLYMAASVAVSMPDVAGSALVQVMSVALVGAFHAVTGFLLLADKVGPVSLFSRKAIGLAGISLAATSVATLAALTAAFVRPLPVSGEHAASVLALAIGAAAVCAAHSGRRSFARRASNRISETLQRG
jgi:hypothetical protein